jgi:hypothetical protein
LWIYLNRYWNNWPDPPISKFMWETALLKFD